MEISAGCFLYGKINLFFLVFFGAKGKKYKIGPGQMTISVCESTVSWRVRRKPKLKSWKYSVHRANGAGKGNAKRAVKNVYACCSLRPSQLFLPIKSMAHSASPFHYPTSKHLNNRSNQTPTLCNAFHSHGVFFLVYYLSFFFSLLAFFCSTLSSP